MNTLVLCNYPASFPGPCLIQMYPALDHCPYLALFPGPCIAFTALPGLKQESVWYLLNPFYLFILTSSMYVRRYPPLIWFEAMKDWVRHGNVAPSLPWQEPFISSLQVITGSTKLFSALLDRCLKRDVIAICRYIPRTNTPPCFVALIPQVLTSLLL